MKEQKIVSKILIKIGVVIPLIITAGTMVFFGYLGILFDWIGGKLEELYEYLKKHFER
jgi:hypothetical protein